MAAKKYHFRVGEFECLSLSDGSLNYPLQALFSNVPVDRVEEALRQRNLPTEYVTTPYTCLYINTGQHQVIIDTGAGNLGAGASKIFPTVDNSTSVTGTLVQSMRGAGVQPEDIDTAIITHAHPDHVGGTLSEGGELIFSNAHYFISKDEWDFWTSDAAAANAHEQMVQTARKNLKPLEDRITLTQDGEEIVAGIRTLATPGHTPGHIALSIASGSEQLLHVSDTVLYPLHLEHPTWLPVFDLSPQKAENSKRRVFDKAADESALVFAHHFPPFPNLGYIAKAGSGWKWQPLEAAREENGQGLHQ